MRFILNRRVGQQLAIGFGSLITFMLVIAATGIGLVSLMQSSLPNEQIIAKQRCAINFRGSVHDRAIAVRDVVLVEKPAQLTPVLAHIATLSKHYVAAAETLDKLMSKPGGALPQERAILTQIQETERQTLPLIRETIAARKDGDAERAKSILMQEARPLFTQWLAQINQLIDFAEAANQAETDAARDQGGRVKLLLIGLTLLATFAGCGLALLITRGITAPIQRVLGVLQGIAGGDLTQPAISSQATGEVGDLARATDQMAATLHKLLTEVATATDAVSTEAEGIASSTARVRGGVTDQARQMEQIAEAIKQMALSLDDVSGKTTNANQAARRSGDLASAGGEAVTGSIADMQTIGTIVSSAAESVSGLGQRSQQIGEIVGVINEIADQTNLLALNAAIEAARAGDHGRGFAVVADEVRKLADRTTTATDEIDKSITAIRSEIGTAIERIEGGANKVQASVERASEASESLNAIVASANDVAGMVESITEATTRQNATSTEISEAIVSINQISQDSATSTRTAAEAAEQLTAQTTTLRTAVAHFRR